MTSSIYHFLFILLNLGLYSETMEGLEEVGILIQDTIVYLIAFNIALTIVIDFIPLSFFKVKKLTIEEELNMPIDNI